MHRSHQVVRSALRTAVRSLALPVAQEQRLYFLLDEAHLGFLDGRVAEGIVMLRRFSFTVDSVARSHRRPARVLERETPFDRLSQARRGRPEPRLIH